MALVHDSDIVSVTEASRRGVSGLVSAVERGEDIVIARRSTPVAAVVSMQRLTELQELQVDLRDLALVLARVASDTGDRTSLDDVITKFGYTRADLQDSSKD